MQKSDIAIPPNDLNMLQTVLDAWCTQQRILRKDATAEAKILINEYKRGTRSQIALIDALINSTTHQRAQLPPIVENPASAAGFFMQIALPKRTSAQIGLEGGWSESRSSSTLAPPVDIASLG